MPFRISLAFMLCPALASLFAPAALQAAPLISVQQRATLGGICAGTGSALPATTAQTGVVLFDTAGHVPAGHDELPATIRAMTIADSGLVLCRSVIEVTEEICHYGLFTVPRIRLDHDFRLVAVRAPSTTLGATRVQGTLPPACNAAGTVTPATTAIRGDAPAMATLLGLLARAGIDAGDTDNDGLLNVAELIGGSDPGSAASPGAQVRVNVNGSSSLHLDEGDSLTIGLTFLPGQFQGLATDYFLWAETRGLQFSYRHPGRFEPSTTPQLAVRAPAQLLADLPLLTLAGLGSGDYTLHFRAIVEGGATFDSSASLTISPSSWYFTNVAAAAGINHLHGYSRIEGDDKRDKQLMAAGVAAGDYDRDGWVDLFVTRGSLGPNLLYRNLGDGTFADVAAMAGVDLGMPASLGKLFSEIENSGATFADYDGDGWLDLLVSGINNTTHPVLFRNNRDGSFVEVSAAAGIPVISQSMGSSFADYDKDGDLDFWMSHWTANRQQKYLFRNDGGVFSDVSTSAGIPNELMGDYAVNFADINNDSWPDVLVAGDFGSSQVWLNQHNGSFALATNPAVITDENGMGAAVGDYDNDQDLDWFVSSIFDTRGPNSAVPGLNWGATGNRFYSNDGFGNFADLTDFTGTREGGWGWGSCFADFNNDGYLDLFHVNGYTSVNPLPTAPFQNDPSRLFINDRQGGFTERSVALGITDNGQGRGIVCFDYDRDGDIDLFVANNEQTPLLYENRGLTRHWLHVRVAGEELNSEAIGARIYLTSGGTTQMRELSAGGNFMSQNPVVAYFGLGSATTADSIRVVWPSGAERTLMNVTADQILLITK